MYGSCPSRHNSYYSTSLFLPALSLHPNTCHSIPLYPSDSSTVQQLQPPPLPLSLPPYFTSTRSSTRNSGELSSSIMTPIGTTVPDGTPFPTRKAQVILYGCRIFVVSLGRVQYTASSVLLKVNLAGSKRARENTKRGTMSSGTEKLAFFSQKTRSPYLVPTSVRQGGSGAKIRTSACRNWASAWSLRM